MNVKFVLLDADYVMLENKPIIRIFGKTPSNQSITIFFTDFFPYFYVKTKSVNKLLEFLERFRNEIVKIEEVEKHEPIGYSEEKVKLIKITLKNPSKVPEIREELNKQSFVEKTYEADILFKYRFLADKNLSGMKWYEAEGNFVNSETVFSELKFEAKNFKETEDIQFEPKVLSIDIECFNEKGKPDPEKHPIILISLAFSHEYRGYKNLVLASKRIPFNNNLFSFESEEKMLAEFLRILREYDPDLIIGYNIVNFDLPYIVKRMQVKGIKPYLGRAKKIPKVEKISEGKYRVSIVGRIVLDIYEILKEMSKKGMFKSKRLGLGDVASILIGETKVDIDKSEIPKLWNGNLEDIKTLIEYSRKDAELVLKLFYKLDVFKSYSELSKLTGLLMQDVLSGSESQRIENLLLREFNKRGFVLPNKPSKKELEERKTKEIKGAIVLEPIYGLHSNVIYLDFKSLYPSIIIEYNICTTTLLLNERKDLKYIQTPYGAKFVSKEIRKGIIPEILSFLIEERDKVKKQMKQEKDEEKKKILDARQWALKILANAFYGYSGYIKARLFVSEIANSITSFGRYWITTIKNIFENELNRKVVYGDTDSVMVKGLSENLEDLFKEAESLEKEINSRTPPSIKMKVEGIFKKIVFLTKKKYAGYLFESPKEEGKIIMKGIETVRRDWCDLVTETLTEFFRIILIEGTTEQAINYLKNVVEKLRKGEIDVEKLGIVKTLSRPLNAYKGQQPHVELVKKMIKRGEPNIPSVGDRITYVIVAGPQKIVERAETVEYVKKNKIPIDVNYYLEHQLLPPLERVLEVLGYTKTQFLTGSKQISIFSIINSQNNGNGKSAIKVSELEGFICENCNQVYRRPFLTLKCECGGKIVFYSRKYKSETIII
ncbi:MAG: DNA-directed DNA polymerase [Candidatus Aenigmatarchaeota archaeon]